MNHQPEHLLDVQDLHVGFRQGSARIPAVAGASFSMAPGEMLALVGESGSGKSITALSILGLLPRPAAHIEQGRILFRGHDILNMSEAQLRQIRGNRISMIFQEPMTALNPVLSVGWQIAEVLRQHRSISAADARSQAVALLAKVGIPDPAKRYDDYPHQLSGGMRQRVMIAIALACEPELLIADEPTTALDVTVQAQIMDLIASLRQELGTAVLLITHNLALVREQADHIAVMYAGSIVEQAPRDRLFAQPAHPYTRLLLRSLPNSGQRGQRLASISGGVPKLGDIGPGCPFAPRCPLAQQRCHDERPAGTSVGEAHIVACHFAAQAMTAAIPADVSPALVTGELLLDIRDLRVWFPIRHGFLSRVKGQVRAVNGVSLQLRRGETLALVGESGCGKTTVGKALVRLAKATAGSAVLSGAGDIFSLDRHAMHAVRKRIQMIFQDPFSSLNPRLSIGESITEGMDAHRIGANAAERRARAEAIMAKVGLPSDALNRYPHQFSGGQRQRIGLARAIAVEPDVVICDECTSALDVSVQAQILNLLKDIQREFRLAYLFITHDLSVVGYLADRVAVMYLGHVVEEGLAHEVLAHPAHPYTHALLAAAPQIADSEATNAGLPTDSDTTDDGREPAALSAPRTRKIAAPRLSGDVPSPANPPSGCPFHTRCPIVQDQCRHSMPPQSALSATHRCHCFFPQR
ncbi:MAG: dipeptide ABC transporter ATP-binding protein [Lentisphaerae bacterium]|nr:dipeptide ABC transporter ATP-binding protein [Lentisphaerota bacterium]